MLTTNDAARELGISGQRVRDLIRAGRLPAEKFGRDFQIREADLERVRDRKPGRPRMDPDLKPKTGPMPRKHR